MEKPDLQPLTEEAVKEIAQLTAAISIFDQQFASIQRLATQYGQLIYHLWPHLPNLCDVCSLPGAYKGALTTDYYCLSSLGEAKIVNCQGIPVKTVLYIKQLRNKALAIKSPWLMPEDHHTNSNNAVIHVWDEVGDIRVHADNSLLIGSFPAMVTSIKYLRQRLVSQNIDMTSVWEELRAIVLTSNTT